MPLNLWALSGAAAVRLISAKLPQMLRKVVRPHNLAGTLLQASRLSLSSTALEQLADLPGAR
jgi:hypothetical protein